MADAAGPRDRVAHTGIVVVSCVVLFVIGGLLLGRPMPTGRSSALPTVNAALNGTSALLLTTGYLLIRRRRIRAHRACMLAAFAASSLFLVSYVVYHARVGSVSFEGEGWIRAVYFPLLVSHIILAAVVPPLALTTIYRGWLGHVDRHTAIARWTLPVWLYVSVTGVVIYWLLYHAGPSS